MPAKKQKIDLTKKVMKKIESDTVSMKPKVYFIAGSVLTGIGFTGVFLASLFFFHLVFFRLRIHQPVGF